MKTSLNNSRYLDPKYVTQNTRKHSPKPYLSPSPASVSKISANSPYKSNTLSKSPNIPLQQKQPVHSLDENDSKLVSKLLTYRQNLVKKLHSHTLIYNIEPLNKCIKHGCYFSVYSKNSHRLLCAQCFTNIQKQKSQKKIVKIMTMNSTTLAQQIEQPSKFKNHKNYLPLQKSKQSLQEDVHKMKAQIQKQNTTLEGIQSILYEGFNEQKKQLSKSLTMIDQRYEEAFNKLKQSHQHYKQNLLKRFNQQWAKHQCVIKQLGLIRSLIKDYLTQFQSYANFKLIIPHSFTQYSVQRKNKSSKKLSNDTQNKEVSLKQTVYQHIVYSQLSQSLKFSQSEFLWSKQKHKNYIKQVSMTIQKGISEIMQKIQKIMSKEQKNIKP